MEPVKRYHQIIDHFSTISHLNGVKFAGCQCLNCVLELIFLILGQVALRDTLYFISEFILGWNNVSSYVIVNGRAFLSRVPGLEDWPSTTNVYDLN